MREKRVDSYSSVPLKINLTHRWHFKFEINFISNDYYDNESDIFLIKLLCKKCMVKKRFLFYANENLQIIKYHFFIIKLFLTSYYLYLI